MLLLVGKGDKLGFYRRAVARPDALYLSVVQRRVGQCGHERGVNVGVGVASPARELLQRPACWHEAEAVEVVLALLHLHVLKVDRAAVDAHGRAGLHPSGGHSVARDALGEASDGRFGNASARQMLASDVQQSVEEGACGEHHALRAQLNAPHGAYAHGAAVLHE